MFFLPYFQRQWSRLSGLTQQVWIQQSTLKQGLKGHLSLLYLFCFSPPLASPPRFTYNIILHSCFSLLFFFSFGFLPFSLPTHFYSQPLLSRERICCGLFHAIWIFYCIPQIPRYTHTHYEETHFQCFADLSGHQLCHSILSQS